MVKEAIRILLINPAAEQLALIHQQLADAFPVYRITTATSPDELDRPTEGGFDLILADLVAGQAKADQWLARLGQWSSQVPTLALVDQDDLAADGVDILPAIPGWERELAGWLGRIRRPSVTRSTPALVADDLESAYRQLQSSARQWEALSEVLRILSATLELDMVLNLILEQAVQVLGAEGGSLVLVDQETKELTFELARGPTAADLVGTRMPWGVGLVGEAAATGQPLIINDAAADPRWFSGYDEATDFVTQSILCAPMITRQQVIGVLEMVNKHDRSPFTEDESELLLALASQAAVAISNARLYAATRRQAEEVAALLETSQAFSATPDLDQRLRIISQKAQELVNADGCVIFMLDKESQLLIPIIAFGSFAEQVMGITLKVGEGVSGQVALTGEGRISNQAHQDPDAKWIPDTPLDPECLLSVPLKVEEGTIGVMTLSREGEHGFRPHDLTLISSLGNQAAVAIENARLYDATRQRNRELTALYSIAMALGQTLEMAPLLEEALRQVLQVLGHREGAIYLVGSQDSELTLKHHQNLSEQAQALLCDPPRDVPAIEKAADRGQIVDEPIWLPDGSSPFRVICVPLLAHQRVMGVLVIVAYDAKPVRPQEVRLLETLGRQVGVAIENASLYAELQKRAETLQNAYDELAQIDRLKDELVQNISHELRTPITFIKGYVSLMMDGDLGGLTEAQHRGLGIVANKTEQLVSLVNGILTLQTLDAEALDLEVISPVDLACHAVAGATITAQESGIQLVADFPDELPFIYADPLRITQVFDNLIQNAIKFSPDGGTITVRLRESGDMIQVQVSDTGIGIPADKIEHIFDRFYQVDGSMKRRFGGAGLGLAICKQIVDAHGGEIWATSEEGAGSTFTVMVPRATAEIDRPEGSF